MIYYLIKQVVQEEGEPFSLSLVQFHIKNRVDLQVESLHGTYGWFLARVVQCFFGIFIHHLNGASESRLAELNLLFVLLLSLLYLLFEKSLLVVQEFLNGLHLG